MTLAINHPSDWQRCAALSLFAAEIDCALEALRPWTGITAGFLPVLFPVEHFDTPLCFHVPSKH